MRGAARPLVPLDIINMENLENFLAELNLTPTLFSHAEREDLNRAWHRLNARPDAAGAFPV